LSHEGAETAALGFELGSTKLNQPASKRAEILARARTASAIEIVGYTDNTGNDSINKRITLARAQIVKDMLVRNGISRPPSSRCASRQACTTRKTTPQRAVRRTAALSSLSGKRARERR